MRRCAFAVLGALLLVTASFASTQQPPAVGITIIHVPCDGPASGPVPPVLV